jgi:hypothetical protein
MSSSCSMHGSDKCLQNFGVNGDKSFENIKAVKPTRKLPIKIDGKILKYY